MTLALKAIQQAIYSKLSGDAVLMDSIEGVFDAVPERMPLPYVVIGDGIQEDVVTVAPVSARIRLTLHVWTDAQGRKTALSVLDRLYGLLHQGTLTLESHQLVTMRVERAATALAEQGTYLHGQLGLSLFVVENAA